MSFGDFVNADATLPTESQLMVTEIVAEVAQSAAENDEASDGDTSDGEIEIVQQKLSVANLMDAIHMLTTFCLQNDIDVLPLSKLECQI